MTEVFKKLNFKDQGPILVVGAPASFEEELRAMTGIVEVHRAAGSGARYGFALAFAPMKADLVKAAKSVLRAIEDGAVVWFAYPKQTSKNYASDLNRDVCSHFAPSAGTRTAENCQQGPVKVVQNENLLHRRHAENWRGLTSRGREKHIPHDELP